MYDSFRYDNARMKQLYTIAIKKTAPSKSAVKCYKKSIVLSTPSIHDSIWRRPYMMSFFGLFESLAHFIIMHVNRSAYAFAVSDFIHMRQTP